MGRRRKASRRSAAQKEATAKMRQAQRAKVVETRAQKEKIKAANVQPALGSESGSSGEVKKKRTKPPGFIYDPLDMPEEFEEDFDDRCGFDFPELSSDDEEGREQVQMAMDHLNELMGYEAYKL